MAISDGECASSLYRVPRALTDPKPPAYYNSINLCKEESPFQSLQTARLLKLKGSNNNNFFMNIIIIKNIFTAKNEGEISGVWNKIRIIWILQKLQPKINIHQS